MMRLIRKITIFLGEPIPMEIELHSEEQEILFPEGIRVIREVTDDPAYTNRELARIR